MTSKGYLHSLPKSVEQRVDLDRYWTPCYVTQSLTQREKFSGVILEPAAGAGHISAVLRKDGYSVVEEDIVTGQDFLARTEQVQSIVTNPPYGLVNQFIAKSLELATEKVALMCRLHVLVSKSRYAIFKDVPGVRAYIFTSPIMMPLEGGGWKKGSAFTHCWLVLDKTTRGRSFDWIQFDKHHPLDPNDL